MKLFQRLLENWSLRRLPV
uniref:Uncharacterized protein n=1 Tax=Rhizophora mucronata TaxID=61149 RepID=A0A2P2PTH0_RHIMU